MVDKGKTLIFKLLAPVASVLIFLAAAELVLRFVGYGPVVDRHGVEVPFWAQNAGTFGRALDLLVDRTRRLTHDVQAYQEDLALYYKLRPEMKIQVSFYDMSNKQLQGPFPDWTLATDANGRRCLPAGENSIQRQNPSPIVHVAVLGGSSMFGWGTDYRNTCAAIFEELANQRAKGRAYRTTNYAVPGYAMSQQCRILSDMIQRRETPDWIILDATSNCDVPSQVTDRSREDRRLSLPGRIRYYLGKCRFFNLMEILIMKLAPRQNISQKRLQTARIPIGEYEGYLARFVDLARKNDIRLILIGMCASRVYVEKMVSFAEAENVPYINFYHLIQEASRRPDSIPFQGGEKEAYRRIYTEELLAENSSLYMTFPDECHPNPTGHRMLARALYDIILKGGTSPQ